jgi:hypothetical protein
VLSLGYMQMWPLHKVFFSSFEKLCLWLFLKEGLNIPFCFWHKLWEQMKVGLMRCPPYSIYIKYSIPGMDILSFKIGTISAQNSLRNSEIFPDSHSRNSYCNWPWRKAECTTNMITRELYSERMNVVRSENLTHCVLIVSTLFSLIKMTNNQNHNYNKNNLLHPLFSSCLELPAFFLHLLYTCKSNPLLLVNHLYEKSECAYPTPSKIIFYPKNLSLVRSFLYLQPVSLPSSYKVS